MFSRTIGTPIITNEQLPTTAPYMAEPTSLTTTAVFVAEPSPVDPKTRPTLPTLRGFKLLKNYRSHEAILWYPNEKFYDNELETFSPTFPVVFHAISGKNEREAPSPSWFNRMEAIQVKAYVTVLVQDRQFPVRPWPRTGTLDWPQDSAGRDDAIDSHEQCDRPLHTGSSVWHVELMPGSSGQLRDTRPR
ncbi:hypothetical protein V8D89_011716 [Ganoderma adspersum]